MQNVRSETSNKIGFITSTENNRLPKLALQYKGI